MIPRFFLCFYYKVPIIVKDLSINFIEKRLFQDRMSFEGVNLYGFNSRYCWSAECGEIDPF